MLRIIIAVSLILAPTARVLRAADPNVSPCWDLRDFADFQNNFGVRVSPRSVRSSDLNGDARVDLADYALLFAQCPEDPAQRDQPEPPPSLARIIIVLVVALIVYMALTDEDSQYHERWWH